MTKNDQTVVINREDIKEVNYVSKEEAANGVQKLFRDDTVQKPDTIYLCFSFLVGTLPLLCGGISMVWMSPMLPYLQSNDSSINPLEKPITVIETSFLGGTPVIVGILGCFIFPRTAGIIGRKNCLLLIWILMSAIYLGQAFSTSVLWIIIFRILFVVVLTGSFIVNQLYLSELCENHNRAKYVCLKTASFPLGNLISYSVGPHLGYRNFNIFSAILGVPCFLFWFAPETPVYYLSKGKVEDCKKTLKKLRSNKSEEELNADFNKIEETLRIERASNSDATFLSLFKTRESRIAMGLTFFLSGMEYFSGVGVITTFLGPLLHEAGSVYSADSMTIMVAIGQFVSLSLTTIVVEKFNRRTLLMISWAGCCLSLFFLGLYYYLNLQKSSLIPHLQWAPIACMIIYIILFGFGLGPLPMGITSELFLPNLVGTALSFGLITGSFVYGFILFIYPILADLLGVYPCIWILSVNCLIGGILVYYFIPETKGKSNIEIQEMLKHY